AAGAVAEALIGADWTRHHTTTDSTLAVFRGRGCIDSLRLYPHAQTEKKATDFVVSGAGRTSTRLFCSRRRKRAVIAWAPAYRSLKKLGRLFKHLLTRYQARRIAADNRQAAGATTPNGTPVSLMSAFGGHGTD